MKQIIVSRTDPDSIGRAIAGCPEGPIVLWHFKSTNDPQHKKNRQRMAMTCQCADGVFTFNEARWRISAHASGGGSGFALLERVPEPAQLETRKRTPTGKRDYRAWWLDKLKEKGWLAKDKGEQPPTPAHTSRPSFGYDFTPEDDA